MRIALAQVDPLVGDLRGNRQLMVEGARAAAARGAHLVVFPELSLVGYPPLDLLDEPEFVLRALAARAETVAALGAAAPGLDVVFGALGESPAPVGKRLLNVAVLARDGAERSAAPKSLLPSYDVFDEDRWFERAPRATTPVDVAGRRIGLSVCEDIWNDAQYWGSRTYERDPISELVSGGADLVINISASPFHHGKAAEREDMLRAAARRHGRAVVFVNQVGGNDELVFDGGSLLVDARGGVVARATRFEPDLVVVDLDDATRGDDAPPPAEPPARDIRRALVLGVRDYVRKCRFQGVLLGLSGGIDSAVVAAIAAEALGPAAVEGVLMPSRYTSDASNVDALDLARRLGMRTRVIPIEGPHAAFLEALDGHLPGDVGTALENVQARARGIVLMTLSNATRQLVLATGNKSELGVGYCTLYGDMVGGLAVIGDCTKRWVRALAETYAEQDLMPRAIIDKAPTAELRPDQRDEDDLPRYAELDPVLEGLVERRLTHEALAREGHSPALIARVRRLLDASEFKRRQAAPILRVTPRAFGIGRRLPIARAGLA